MFLDIINRIGALLSNLINRPFCPKPHFHNNHTDVHLRTRALSTDQAAHGISTILTHVKVITGLIFIVPVQTPPCNNLKFTADVLNNMFNP